MFAGHAIYSCLSLFMVDCLIKNYHKFIMKLESHSLVFFLIAYHYCARVIVLTPFIFRYAFLPNILYITMYIL
jgi:hypothetical protein